jgi:ATP-dependent exoDNAse (exonuclease V) alpha subunit
MAAAEIDGRTLSPQTVTVVDEAAMIPATHLERLAHEVDVSGGKLVLVGDERQLQPLGPGATFGHLTREAAQHAPESSSTIQQIMRQRHASQQVKAIAALAAAGRPDAALRRADEAGRVRVHSQHDAMLRGAARDIANGRMAGKDAMGLVPTRSEAAQLNAMIREELRGRGLLSQPDVRFVPEEGHARHEIALAVGDRVAFTTNHYRAGVYNGMRGTIIGISPRGDLSVRLDEGYKRVGRDGTVRTDPVLVCDAAAARAVCGAEAAQYVNVPAYQVAQRTSEGYTYVTHDYARTLPRAQGTTIDHAVVAAHAESNAFCRQWGTVALTRHREDVQVHLSAAGLRHDRVLTYEPAHWPREDRQEASVDRGQYAVPELHDRSFTSEPARDDKTHAEALDEAAGRLAQDRPGPSTLDYQKAQPVERWQEMGARSALGADMSEERNPGHDATIEGVMFEPDLAIEKGGI